MRTTERGYSVTAHAAVLGAGALLCSDRALMSTSILETERLVFRPFTPDDLDLVTDLHSDPEVQRYLGGMWAPPEMQATLDRFVLSQATHDYSKWAVFLRDGTFVGRAGVSRFPALTDKGFGGDRELGYTLKQAFWGSGIASEAAGAVRDWFWANTDETCLIGFTHPENLASQRVLVKTGMAPLGFHDLGFGEPSAVFRMMRPQ